MKKRNKLQITILSCLFFVWLSANLFYFWIKLGGLSLLISGILELVCFLIGILSLIILIIKILKHKDRRCRKNYAVIGTSIILIVLICFPVLQIDENTFRSPVKMRYCCEGTMNTSRLYFRENGKFEDFNIGFFAYGNYCSGTWEQSGDTIKLNFKRGERYLLGELLIEKSEVLYKIEGDSLITTFYYAGQCKGLN